MDEGLSVRADKLFRNIVERSAMTNNDEWVSYTDSPMSPGDAAPHKLVISRPVYGFEVDAGLAIEGGSLWDMVDEPDATRLADALWRVKAAFDGYARAGMFGGDMAKAVVHEITFGYYDCMSGGCSTYVLSILRYACEEFNVSGDTNVYPGGPNGWYTISDFLEDTKGMPDIREVMGEGMKSLPSLVATEIGQ